MTFDVATLSEAGPRSFNEDTVSTWALPDGALVIAVADGLGGMGGGAMASALAIKTLQEEVVRADHEALVASAYSAHEKILAAQLRHAEQRRMATTLTAVILNGDSMMGVHCGDTRASIARSQGVKRLTVDQSEGQRLFAAGKLTKEELREYPRLNILDSALGAPDGLKIERFQFDLQVGDKIFLTSDGVHGKILLREMRQIASNHQRAQSFIEEVEKVLLSRNPDDNFTIAVAFVMDDVVEG